MAARKCGRAETNCVNSLLGKFACNRRNGDVRVAGFGNETTSQRFNVVLIVADDLGWSDLGCYGADLLETPSIDKLAKGAIRFTDAYAASVCTPTRACLLTGKHYARLHMTVWREAAQDPPHDRKLVPPVAVPDLPR